MLATGDGHGLAQGGHWGGEMQSSNRPGESMELLCALGSGQRGGWRFWLESDVNAVALGSLLAFALGLPLDDHKGLEPPIFLILDTLLCSSLMSQLHSKPCVSPPPLTSRIYHPPPISSPLRSLSCTFANCCALIRKLTSRQDMNCSNFCF